MLVHRPRSATRACVLAATFSLAAQHANAQSAQDVAARRLLLRQAEEARAHGDHAGALELADRAGRIQMTPSVRMFIAQEQAAVGHVAEAFGNADTCVHEAERDTTLVSRGTIMENCRRLVASLGERVGRVTVRVATPAPTGLGVSVSGHSLSDAFWGVPYSVDPGTVAVDATAPGYVAFHQDVQVAAGQSAEVTVTLAAEAPPPPANPAPVTPPPEPAPTPAPVPLPPHPADANSHVPASAILLGSVGVAAAATAIVFYELAGTRGANLALDCSMDRVCDDTPANRAAYSDGRTFTAAGDVAIAVGIVGIAAGAVLWLTAPKDGNGENLRAAIAPVPGGGAVLSVGGSL